MGKTINIDMDYLENPFQHNYNYNLSGVDKVDIAYDGNIEDNFDSVTLKGTTLTIRMCGIFYYKFSNIKSNINFFIHHHSGASHFNGTLQEFYNTYGVPDSWEPEKGSNITGTVFAETIDASEYSTAKKSYKINTGSGNDTVIGSKVNDTVTCKTLKDETATVTEAYGTNKVTYGKGNDVFTAAAGSSSNTVNMNSGDNTAVINSTGYNKITAGNGHNLVTVTSGENTIKLGNGTEYSGLIRNYANRVDIAGGYNTVTTGKGNDIVNVTAESTNTIKTGAGVDTITLAAGTNIVDAGAGDDNFIITGGNNILDGGAGNDLYDVAGFAHKTDELYIKDTKGQNILDFGSKERVNIYFDVTQKGKYSNIVFSTNNATTGFGVEDVHGIQAASKKSVSKLAAGNGTVTNIYDISAKNIDALASQVAAWLKTNNYASTDAVFAGNDGDDKAALVAMYTNFANNDYAVPQA